VRLEAALVIARNRECEARGGTQQSQQGKDKNIQGATAFTLAIASHFSNFFIKL
jgi:hypothetical protein